MTKRRVTFHRLAVTIAALIYAALMAGLIDQQAGMVPWLNT